MRKIIRAASILLLSTLLLCSCKTNNNDVSENMESTDDITIKKITEEITTEESTTEVITEKTYLSDDCDIVLAEGYDKDENYYELVATETEDFDGTKIKIGVIKNNEWSIKLTSKSKFIGEEGLLRKYTGNSNVTGSIYDDYAAFYYIGNGCFYYDGIILNGNTNKYYTGNAQPIIQCKGLVSSQKNDTAQMICANDGKILLEDSYDSFSLLDTNTMKVKVISSPKDYNMHVFPYSEGLIAYLSFASGKSDINGFYNIRGEKVIDLSKYDLSDKVYDINGIGGDNKIMQSFVFEDGKCTFYITNDQGTDYKITINKKGKVIDSIQENFEE